MTTESADVAVELEGLTRTFRRGRRTLVDRAARRPDRREEVGAVNGIDLRIGRAEIFGLLGPNGAGKSTTIRIIATLLEPTSGTVYVCGNDVRTNAVGARRHLGVVLGGERSVYWKLTGRENLRYFAALYHIPRAEVAGRIEEVLADTQLTERADDYVERYSTGMRQRLAIARSLLARPCVLVLDEPTAGLDPQATAHLRERIRQLRTAGRTVVLTTHDMGEAAELCDRIAIVDAGRVVALGNLDQLRANVGAAQVVHLELDHVGFDEPQLIAEIGQFATVVSKQSDPPSLALVLHTTVRDDLLPRLVAIAARHAIVLRHFEVEPVTLEDVFLALTGRSLRE